jgi:hypothetical protein
MVAHVSWHKGWPAPAVTAEQRDQQRTPASTTVHCCPGFAKGDAVEEVFAGALVEQLKQIHMVGSRVQQPRDRWLALLSQPNRGSKLLFVVVGVTSVPR